MRAQVDIDLTGRNAISDYDHVASHLVFDHVPFCEEPSVSIAIPTFRRIGELIEAIESALAQDCIQKCEIVIVDNDPDSSISQILKNIIVSQSHMIVRYYRNAENIGMFGNWNRAIALSRGSWMTILNDDDLLSPSFVYQTLSALAKVGGEGIVCYTDTYDRRPEATLPSVMPVTFLAKVRKFVRFGRHGLTPLTPRMLFFGNDAGNSAGFLFRRDVAVRIGGFLPEEWPASDYMFYVRFAIAARIFLFRSVLAHVGIGENESMRSETLLGFVTVLDGARRALAGRVVPAAWLALSPQLTANFLLDIEDVWGVRLDKAAVAKKLDVHLPRPNRRYIRWKRLMLRAY